MSRLEGPALALAAAVSFGGTTAAAKALLGEVRPFMLAGLLYMGAGLGLCAYMFARRVIRKGKPGPSFISRQDVPWLSGAVLAGGIVAPLLLMWGLQRTPASTVSLLLNLEGVLTVLIAWIVFRENIGSRVTAGVLAIVAGAAVLSIGPATGGQQGLIGHVAVVGACLGWAVDNNLTRRISARDPSMIAGIKGVVAGTVNISLASSLGQPFPGPKVLAISGTVGFIGYGASLVLFVLALRAMGAARTGALFSTGPFIGAIAAVLILGEEARPVLIPAALLMGIGLWLQVSERHDHEHVHVPMHHTHLHAHDEHHDHEHEDGTAAPKRHQHPHAHEEKTHSHRHYPDIHHRHGH